MGGGWWSGKGLSYGIVASRAMAAVIHHAFTHPVDCGKDEPVTIDPRSDPSHSRSLARVKGLFVPVDEGKRGWHRIANDFGLVYTYAYMCILQSNPESNRDNKRIKVRHPSLCNNAFPPHKSHMLQVICRTSINGRSTCSPSISSHRNCPSWAPLEISWAAKR